MKAILLAKQNLKRLNLKQDWWAAVTPRTGLERPCVCREFHVVVFCSLACLQHDRFLRHQHPNLSLIDAFNRCLNADTNSTHSTYFMGSICSEESWPSWRVFPFYAADRELENSAVVNNIFVLHRDESISTDREDFLDTELTVWVFYTRCGTPERSNWN